jgi:spore coat protein CotH
VASRDLKVIWGSVALSVVLAIGFALKVGTETATPAPKPAATPTQPADPTALTDLNKIFDPSQISDIQLDIPAKSQKVLDNRSRDEYVPATFQITIGNQKSPKLEVRIKIKGTTSRYGINTTYQFSSYKVKFAFGKQHKTQTLLGLKSLTLNAMTQDSSKLHETFAYETYRAMGVPASRTGYAHIRMSKNIPKPDRGLYLVLESLDDVFLGANFNDVTQHLYENNHNFTEIFPGYVGKNVKIDARFQVKEGWKATPNRSDLKVFAKGIQSSGKKLWDFLETNTDRERLIMLFAVDNFTGGWDTYSGPLLNNYQFRSNQLGKFTFIPWGLDNTWGENYFNDVAGSRWVKSYTAPSKLHDDFFFPVDSNTASFPGSFMIAYNAGVTNPAKMTNYQLGRGQLFRKCLTYSPCATLYFQDLQKVSDWATSTNLPQRMIAQGAVIKKLTNGYSKAEQTRTSNWVLKQQARVAKAIAKHCELKENVIQSCK